MRDTAHTAAEGAGAVPRLPDMPPVDLAITATAAHHGLAVLHDEEPVVPIRRVPHP